MGTNASNSGPYCTAAEFLKRCDARTVAKLCSDTGTPVETAALAADPNLAAALLDASGAVEMACLVGGRYAAADLAALPANSPAQGALYRLVTQLALCMLYDRRPLAADQKPWYYDATMAQLDALAEGKRLFAIQENIDAGVVESDVESREVIEERAGMVVTSPRFFGRRVNQQDR